MHAIYVFISESYFIIHYTSVTYIYTITWYATIHNYEYMTTSYTDVIYTVVVYHLVITWTWRNVKNVLYLVFFLSFITPHSGGAIRSQLMEIFNSTNICITNIPSHHSHMAHPHMSPASHDSHSGTQGERDTPPVGKGVGHPLLPR